MLFLWFCEKKFGNGKWFYFFSEYLELMRNYWSHFSDARSGHWPNFQPTAALKQIIKKDMFSILSKSPSPLPLATRLLRLVIRKNLIGIPFYEKKFIGTLSLNFLKKDQLKCKFRLRLSQVWSIFQNTSNIVNVNVFKKICERLGKLKHSLSTIILHIVYAVNEVNCADYE